MSFSNVKRSSSDPWSQSGMAQTTKTKEFLYVSMSAYPINIVFFPSEKKQLPEEIF